MKVRFSTHGGSRPVPNGYSQAHKVNQAPTFLTLQARSAPPPLSKPNLTGIAIFGLTVCIASIAFLTGIAMAVGIIIGIQFFAPLVGRFLKKE